MPDSPKFSTSFHEKLLDSLYDGVYFVDQDRRITYWNHGAETLTGYTASDAVGRQCFDNFLEHVDEGGCALCVNDCPLAATIGDGQRREAEVYLRHKAGHRIPVSVRVAPLRDTEGLVVGAVEIFTDVQVSNYCGRIARPAIPAIHPTADRVARHAGARRHA